MDRLRYSENKQYLTLASVIYEMNDLGDIERVCDIFIFARNVLSTEAIYDQRVSSLENTRVAKLTKSEPLVHPSFISEAFRAWLRDPCEERLTYV